MRTPHRIAAAVLTTSVIVAGTTAAAQAESTTLKDKSSDVVSLAGFDDEQGTQLGYADSVASGVDLRSMKVKHSKKSVTITLRFSELKSDTMVSAMFRLDGKSQPQRDLTSTSRKRAVITDNKGKKRCSVPLTTTTGTGGSVRAVIKRSCLGDPKKIKVAAAAYVFDVKQDDFSARVDVLSPTNIRTETYTKWLKAS